MSDVLIRNIPEGVLAALDSNAVRLGLSRTEYLRRQLTQAAAVGHGSTLTEDWKQFGDLAADLSDPDVMESAWQ